jgi:hypothetical protein
MTGELFQFQLKKALTLKIEWTGKMLKSLGFGKAGNWRRPRREQSHRLSLTRPTEYYIKRQDVINLARRHKIDSSETD